MIKVRLVKHSEHEWPLQLSRLHPVLQDFSSIRYSSQSAYIGGGIAVAFERLGRPVGFYCARHKVRVPETSLYFIGVRPPLRRGVGTALLQHLMMCCEHPRIVLNCLKDNEVALAFYRRHGFVIAGEALGGQGWLLRKEWSRI